MLQGLSYVRYGNLYIRNVIPAGAPLLAGGLVYRGGAMPNFVLTAFCEVELRFMGDVRLLNNV
jgi:hypothetical protein